MGTIGDKKLGVMIDPDALLAGAQAICQANSITNDAGWSAHIDSRTDPQILTMLRNFFKTLIKVG